jgi:hypothetical protein
LFRERWQREFDELIASEQGVQVFTISQGCVIERTNGEVFQLRNFKVGTAWMNGETFKNIKRVHRSPLAAMRHASASRG